MSTMPAKSVVATVEQPVYGKAEHVQGEFSMWQACSRVT